MKKIFKNFKFSLRLKIASLFLLLVIAMMATVTYIYTIRELNLRVQHVKLRMERLAQNIATIRSVETEDWEVYQSYIDNQIKVSPDIVYIAIFDEYNILKAYSLNSLWLDLESDQPMSRMDQINIVLRLDQRQVADESQQDLESQSVNIIIGDRNLGTVKVGFSLVDLNDEMKKNLYRNFELAVIFIILAIFASLFISQKVVTPLSKLTNAMVQISHGNLNQELHIDSRDEIGEMTKTFNFMTQGLREKELIESFSHQLGFTIEFEKITKLITERVTLALNGKSGFLFIREKDEASVFHSVYAFPDVLLEAINFARNPVVCKQFIQNKVPLFWEQLDPESEIFQKITSSIAPPKYSLISPIIINEEVIGLFLLIPRTEAAKFSESERFFLNTLINQAAFALENALLLNELTEQERMKRELEIARMVQLSLLPQKNPQLPGLDIDGICIPATEIGGDYFDYFLLNDHTIGVTIADVAGKGTSAAFYMAVVKGMMLSLTPIFKSPREVLIELNRRLYGTMDRKIFVTMIYGIFDVKKSTLKFARAGHNALIIKNNQKSTVENLTPQGIGLGLEDGSIFSKTISEQQVKFKQGDKFIFYTDGITEAMDLEKQEFGEARLFNQISNEKIHTSIELRQSIIQSVIEFVNNAQQHDDITMVTISAT